MPVIEFERQGQVGIARLNVESSLNALSLEMIDLLYPQLRQWQSDEAIRLVWLEAAGTRAFCAGGDVVRLHESILATPAGSRNRHAEDFFAHEYRLDFLLHTYTKPIVCWAEGIVMGGGLGLLAGCSHRVVTPTSRIAMPEITIGLYPDVGASRFLLRMPGEIGLFLGLTGASLNANDAHYVGLADHVLSGELRDTLKAKLGNRRLDDDRRRLDAQLSLLLREHGLPLAAWPKAQVKPHFDLINQLCAGTTLPEVVEAILVHASDDAWLTKAKNTLASGCPQTAWLVWIARQQAQGLSLADVFRMEWILSMQCIYHDDFREGVRALLVDKDKTPHFRHRHVSEVPEAYLEAFFEMPPGVERHPLEDLGRA